MKTKNSALSPTTSVLAKLGSIIRHLEEYESPNGIELDLLEAISLSTDIEVENWMAEMDKLALLPVRR